MKERILEKIDTDFVIQLLSDYGASSKGLRFTTVCHGGDGYNLQYYPETKSFCCFSCCGSMDIFALISKIENCSYGQAIKILASRLGIKNDRTGFVKREKVLYDTNLSIKGFAKYINAKNEAIDDLGYYNYFDENTFYKGWIDEGISIDVMRKFGIRWDEMDERIIIPVKNINGNIVGVRYRALNKQAKNKYGIVQKWSRFENKDGTRDLLLNYTFDSGKELFGLYQNQDIIKKYRRAVVFEGEKSVMKCNSWFGEYPAVATFTHNITEIQIKLLADLGVRKVVIAYDMDALEDSPIMCDKIKKWGMSAYYIDGTGVLGEKDAPVDLGKETYLKLYETRNIK